jgi:uracil-DNA glycosylase family 4
MENLHNKGTRCPKCGKLLIPPFGNPQSPYLLVGDFPGYQETVQGVPFTFRRRPTETRSGDILQAELNRVGISLNTVLLTNLWMHQPGMIEVQEGKKKKKVEACPMAFHLDQLTSLFSGRTHVLLMGSKVVPALTGQSLDAVSGLRVEVHPFKKVHFWVGPNPSTLLGGQPIGELRLAFGRFAEDVRQTK